MGELAALERAVKRVTGQRPERQLDDVVVELGGAGGEVVEPVADQDGGEGAGGADELPRGEPDGNESDDDGDLGQRGDREGKFFGFGCGGAGGGCAAE